jgi:hypothetical protein
MHAAFTFLSTGKIGVHSAMVSALTIKRLWVKVQYTRVLMIVK